MGTTSLSEDAKIRNIFIYCLMRFAQIISYSLRCSATALAPEVSLININAGSFCARGG